MSVFDYQKNAATAQIILLRARRNRAHALRFIRSRSYIANIFAAA